MKCCKCKKSCEEVYMVGVSTETQHLKDKEYCEECFKPVALEYGLLSKQESPSLSIVEIADSP